MKLHSWSALEREQLNPTFARRALHTSRMTIARVEMKAGGVVPVHQHENEQVTLVLSGHLRFVAEGITLEARTGEVVEIPSQLPHSVIALEDSEAFDLFAPIRHDWLQGQDAYLRGSGGAEESSGQG